MLGTIGEYHLLNKIGSGGFGTVFRAYDPYGGRAVALKVLKPSADEEDKERFRREGLILAAIDHDHVIRLLDVRKDDMRLLDGDTPYVFGDVSYIVMELMPLSLKDAMKASGKLSLSRSLDLFCQVTLGLRAVHDRGVVHRDIKPQNVLLNGDGRAIVADFGIARTEDSDLTKTGVFGFGSRRYMSPEQFIDPKRVDERADIYSLGVTLYEMLTGKRYKPGASAKASRSAIPDALESIVRKCVDPAPEQRYRTMRELGRAIINRGEFTRSVFFRCALIDLYEATGGPNWRHNDNWLTDAPLGEWYGVNVNAHGAVVELDLNQNNLIGRIPEEIAYLVDLVSLNIGYNHLSGAKLTEVLPNTLLDPTYLKSLDALDLSGNEFTGEIPRKLCDLNLGELHLEGNDWTGCIPRALFDISANDLNYLDLPICDD